ncbi:hypothetical protein KC723_03400 [Candidatus Kaiserbacteria bacterium]|nr:hypothetical protein [Candidatus Kaiserbacteria bacterium]
MSELLEFYGSWTMAFLGIFIFVALAFGLELVKYLVAKENINDVEYVINRLETAGCSDAMIMATNIVQNKPVDVPIEDWVDDFLEARSKNYKNEDWGDNYPKVFRNNPEDDTSGIDGDTHLADVRRS